MTGRGNDGRGRPPPIPPRLRSSPAMGRARPAGRPPAPPRYSGPRTGSLIQPTYLASSSSSDPTPQHRGEFRPPPLVPGIRDSNVTSLTQRMAELETITQPGTAIPSSLKTSTQPATGESPGVSAKPQAVSAPAVSAQLPSMPEIQSSTMFDAPQFYRGDSGKMMELCSNYLKMVTEKDMGVFQYDVKFSPRVDNKEERYRLLNQQRDLFDGGIKMFDGAILYTRKKTEGLNKPAISINERGEKYQLTFLFKRKCNPGDRQVIQLYNILFGRIFRVLKFSQHKRKYFDSQGAYNIREHNINVWPGYVTAVDQYEGGLLLQLDASFRVLRTETVRDLMRTIYIRYPSNTKPELDKALLGVSVLTRYNNKSYVIDEIDTDASVKDTFHNEKGQEISYIDYYKNQYNIEIMDKEQPLLLHRVRKKAIGEEDIEKVICLVPELCLLTGLTDAMRADFRVMQEVAKFTRISPQKRIESIDNFIRRVNGSEVARQILADWGLSIIPQPIKLSGRILNPETMYFGGNYKEIVSSKGDWNRAATSKPVLTAVALKKWAIFFPHRSMTDVRAFCTTMIQQAKRMGIEMSNPKPVSLDNDRNETYLREIKAVIDPSVQLVLAVFPQMKTDRYSAVKRLCCLEMPIPSQVVNLKTISNPKRLSAVCQKIALQINCKLGGELWACQTPFKNLMVVGIDVFHQKSQKTGSVAGVVASLNDTHSRFYSCVAQQIEGQEMIDALKTSFMEAINRYRSLNNCYPSEIVVFRDGVGDGQMETIRQHEAEQFYSLFKTILPPTSSGSYQNGIKRTNESSAGYRPGFSFVVVQKRINTRVFTALRGTTGYENPPPGTIVDHTVTRYSFKDFFLVPQSVTQGTVTPTHFVVVEESNSTLMSADNLQKLAYKLTHMYYNWPGTVRVPAPCQYAHKLVDLVGDHLRQQPSPDLNDCLYYL